MSIQVNPASCSGNTASAVRFGGKKPVDQSPVDQSNVEQPGREKFEKSGDTSAGKADQKGLLKVRLKAAKDFALNKKDIKRDALWGLAWSVVASILPGSQLLIFPVCIAAPMLHRAFMGFTEGYKLYL